MLPTTEVVLTEINPIAVSELHREHTGELSSSFILHILFVSGPLVADVIYVGLQVSNRSWIDVASLSSYISAIMNISRTCQLCIFRIFISQNFDQKCFRYFVWRHDLWQ